MPAEALRTRVFSDVEWDWESQVVNHSLGWVVARDGADLVAFANVVTNGFIHAWLQDVMVASSAGRQGIGIHLVAIAKEGAQAARGEFLHVHFAPHLDAFYIQAGGFERAPAGLMRL